MTTSGPGGEQQVPVVGTVSILQLWDMVREESGLTGDEMESLPLMTTMVVSREIQWTVGRPVPGARKPGEGEMMVFALFHGPDDHDVTVYALPREAKPVGERHWARYTLNRVAPTMTVETMNRQGFMSAAAGRLLQLAIDEGVAEDEDDESEEPEDPEEPVAASVRTL